VVTRIAVAAQFAEKLCVVENPRADDPLASQAELHPQVLDIQFHESSSLAYSMPIVDLRSVEAVPVEPVPVELG
jgi:hypothetical protein